MSLSVRVRGPAASMVAAAAFLTMMPARARAQDQAPPPDGPAPAAQPAGEPPPPPRGYPPPPPRPTGQYPYGYPNQNPYGYPNQNYYAPPLYQPRPSYRPFSFTVGLGPGVLGGLAVHDVALSYLFRFAFAVAERTSFVLGYEGAGTSTVSAFSNEDAWLTHNVVWGGLQFHVRPALYLRGGVGFGWGTESSDSLRTSTSGGVAAVGGVGWEFIQGNHTALALEIDGNVARYERQTWGMAGLNLALSFY